MSLGENEAIVRYALDKWPKLKLIPQQPHLGGAGLVGKAEGLLSEEEAQWVQRFDPGVWGDNMDDRSSDDTIGFFIAHFVRDG